MSSTAWSATGAGSSTSPAEPAVSGAEPNVESEADRLHLTRRALLASTAAVPVLTALPTLTAPLVGRGEPFDDGTWFDDGYGWVD